MEVRSEPSFNTGVQNSPSSSTFPVVRSVQANCITGGGDFLATQELTANAGEQVKRSRRGRPRKYASPDGPMPLGMASDTSSSQHPSMAQAGFSSGLTLSSELATTTKKKRKPLGLGKKRQMDALGSSGVGFTPHVITVKAGEDVSAKIMSFSNSGPRTVCVLSANGAISSVTVRQAGSSGGTATYEGRYEILSLSGSILLAESSGECSRTGGLSVSLAGPDGNVLGGGVAGLLIAATPVQVVVGSFKERQSASPLVVESTAEKLTQGAMAELPSPISRGIMSEPSGGGHCNPYNLSSNGSNHHNGISSQGLATMPWK